MINEVDILKVGPIAISPHLLFVGRGEEKKKKQYKRPSSCRDGS
jgi:hypothetical protein